jgi:uncharacterized protein (TIGR02145 family)
MAENLKTTRFNNGDSIPLVISILDWRVLSSPGYCWFNDDASIYKNTYGALYNWYTINSGKLAPEGWHVPTDAEWTILIDFLGGVQIAGGKMKEAGTAHWVSPNTGADNSSGFSALPGGYRGNSENFEECGGHGYWWTGSQSNSFSAWTRHLEYDSDWVNRYEFPQTYGFSVRCIKD